MLLLGLRADAAMLPGRTVVTVGTSAQASDGSEWGYLFLNETDTDDAGCSDCPSVAVPVPGLPAHPASPTGYVAVYAKEGAAGSTNAFLLKSVLTRAVDAVTIRGLLERSRRLGDVPELIDERLTTLFGPLVPASSIDVAEKLSAVIRGAQGVEDHEQNLRLMARQHPGIAMCLGLADAQAISTTPGVLTTFELRQWNPSVNQDGPVVGRVTVVSRQPLPLPPPFAPVVVPDATAKGDLNLKMRWAMTDELKRVALVSQGFDVFRVDRALAEKLGWHLTPPTTAALLSASTTNAAWVVRVNEVPVLAGQNYTAAGAADLVNDPSTTFVLDDNDRFDVGGRPFIDGAEFYYFVGARDLLGRVGTLSPGTLGRVCDRIPPAAPREVQVRARHLWDGTTARDRLEVSWKPYTAAGTEMPAAYYVYRWNGPTAALSPSARTAVPVAGPIVHDPARSVYTWLDDGVGSPTVLANAGQQIWYTVRAADDGVCGPNLSGDSSPGMGVLRDRFGPVTATGTVSIRCVQPRVDLLAPPKTSAGGAGGNLRTYRLSCVRSNQAIEEVQFYFARATDPTPVPLPVVGFSREPNRAALSVDIPYVPGGGLLLGCEVSTRLGSKSSIQWVPVPQTDDTVVTEVPFTSWLAMERVVADADCRRHTVPRPGTPGSETFGGSADSDAGGITLTLDLPPQAREYRVYRCVDGGVRTLIATGAGTNTVTVTDESLPVNAATLCYFVQVLDQHGNPSAVARLEPEVAINGVLPVPALESLKSLGTFSSNTNSPLPAPSLRLNWTCAEPGVDRFEVWLNDGTGQQLASTSDELIHVGEQLDYVDDVDDGVEAGGDYSRFVTPRLATGFGTNATFGVTFAVVPGRTYTALVKAIGVDGTRGGVSAARRSSWQPASLPLGVGQVPWPARPLPSLTSGFHPQLLPYQLSEDEFKGVAIAIGEVDFGRTMSAALIAPPYRIEGVSAVEDLLYPDYRGSNVLSCVLYRHQVPNSRYPEVSGDVIQVSPLMETIVSRRLFETVPGSLPYSGVSLEGVGRPVTVETRSKQSGKPIRETLRLSRARAPRPSPGTRSGSGSGGLEITDPFIVLAGNGRPGLDSYSGARIYLKDTQPIVEGARYRYVLARFQGNHEIEQLIRVGEVDIEESNP
jgi:hypothetical protein